MDEIKAQKIPRLFLNNLNHSSPLHSFRSSYEPNEYVTLALAAEAERERLLELITVLNRRLDKERNDADILSVGYHINFLYQRIHNKVFFNIEYFAERKKQVGEIRSETWKIRG